MANSFGSSYFLCLCLESKIPAIMHNITDKFLTMYFRISSLFIAYWNIIIVFFLGSSKRSLSAPARSPPSPLGPSQTAINQQPLNNSRSCRRRDRSHHRSDEEVCCTSLLCCRLLDFYWRWQNEHTTHQQCQSDFSAPYKNSTFFSRAKINNYCKKITIQCWRKRRNESLYVG